MTSLLFFLVLAVVAYVLAVVLYIVTYRLVQLPHGEFMDEATRPALQFILLTIVVVVCLLPMFNAEWDATLRRFGLLVALFVVLFSGGRSAGIFTLDPGGSLHQVIDQVVHPLAKRFGTP